MGKRLIGRNLSEIVGEAHALQVLNDLFGVDTFIGSSVEMKLGELVSLIYHVVDDSEYHGATITNNQTKVTYVALNTGQSLRKRYFTACHELWHVLKIKDMIGSLIDEERAAERFAAALMLPAPLMKLIWDGVKSKDEERRVIQIADMASAPYVAVAKRVVELNISKNKGLVSEEKNEQYWVDLRKGLGIPPSPLDDSYPYVNFKDYEEVVLQEVDRGDLGLLDAATKLSTVSPDAGKRLQEKWSKLVEQANFEDREDADGD